MPQYSVDNRTIDNVIGYINAGRVLPEALAEKLESIWARYTKKLHDEGSIDGERAAFFDWKD